MSNQDNKARARNAIWTVFACLKPKDLEQLLDAEKEHAYAALHYGNSGQLEALMKAQSTLDRIVSEMSDFTAAEICEKLNRAGKVMYGEPIEGLNYIENGPAHLVIKL